MSDAPFVGIADAARQLGIGERHARRLVAAMSDTDIRMSRDGHGRALRLVRLEALKALLSGGEPIASALVDADIPSRTRSAPRRTAAAVSDIERRVPGPSDTSLVEELRAELAQVKTAAAVAEARAELLASEREHLREALTREQETAGRLAARLEDADARLGAILAATGRLQVEAPKSTADTTAPDPGPGDTQSALAPSDAPAGRTEGREAYAAPHIEPSQWWRKVWPWGKS